MKPEFLESAEFYNRRYHIFFQCVGDFNGAFTSARVFTGICSSREKEIWFVYQSDC